MQGRGGPPGSSMYSREYILYWRESGSILMCVVVDDGGLSVIE
jgi:hypothetical protein